MTRSRIEQWSREQSLPDLLPRTRARLQRLIAAKQRELEVFPRCFETMLSGPVLTEGGSGLPPSQDGRLKLLECYEHVFRDWCWGGEESRRLLALGPGLREAGPRHVAVYGAGAARFAAELHRDLAPAWTFAIDHNPLPLLLAARALAGEPTELFEYPVSPTSDRHVAVLQQLNGAELDAPGLELVLADALQPPFAAGALDLIVLPWFVDVCGVDLRVLLRKIRRLLSADGWLWLLGPLDFDTWLSQAYCFEEVQELIALEGFSVAHAARNELPYFDSPHSGSRRVESVYSVVARRHAGAELTTGDLLSDWLSQLTPALRNELARELGR